MSKTKKANNTKVACTCRNCGNELVIHRNDDKAEAVKRNRWSNVDTHTNTGICRRCGKKGLR
jgi:hypothetical protein